MKIKKNFIYFFKLYFSMLKKRQNDLYVCGAWHGDKFADNSKYFYLYALKNGKKAVWITKNHEIYNNLKCKNMPVALMGTKESRKLCRLAKYAVISTGKFDVEADCIGGATVINLWHGIPLKKIAYDDHITADSISLHKRIWNKLNNFANKKTYYFSTSDKISKIYQSCFRTDKDHIIQIGQARNDVFFDGCLKKIKYSNVEYDKLIVYMPTHRNEGKTIVDIYSLLDLERLNNYCKNNKILFLIKKHYYNRNDGKTVEGYSNIIDYTDKSCDTQELLFNTDVLITDYSSCYIDYLLLNRPIIFYCYDYNEYLKQDREMYFEYDEVTPGDKAKNFDMLIESIDKAINGNKEYLDDLKRVKNIFYSLENQGIVCHKLLEKIDKL